MRGEKRYQVLLGLLLLLIAFFAFGMEEPEVTGQAVQKLQSAKASPAKTQPLNIETLPAGTKIIQGNKIASIKQIQGNQADPFNRLASLLHSPSAKR